MNTDCTICKTDPTTNKETADKLFSAALCQAFVKAVDDYGLEHEVPMFLLLQWARFTELTGTPI